MTDLRPSIPRTPAQATLRLVSTIMGIVGVVVALAGVLAIWYCESMVSPMSLPGRPTRTRESSWAPRSWC